MRIAAIGVGGAGASVVDALQRDDAARQSSYLTAARVLDTDPSALSALRSIPEEHRDSFGMFETGGGDTGGDRSVGLAAVESDLTELRRTADAAITSDVAAVVVVVGLGGGTGSAAAPKLVAALREVYELPIYSVSILPDGEEDSITANNAVEGLRALDDLVDAQITFDNDAWLGSGASMDDEDAVERLNDALAERVGALFSAGETTAEEVVAESVVDANEIITTLDAGGLVSIGYSNKAVVERDIDASLLDRLKSRFSEDEPVDEVRAIQAVETTLREAVRGKLTLECDRDAGTRALFVVAGPPEWLNRRAISDGRRWLTDELDLVEIRSGDAPRPGSDSMAVLVAIAGVSESERLEALVADR